MAIQVTELSDLRTYPSHTLFRAALISPQGVAGMRRNTRRAGKEEIRGFGQSFASWREGIGRFHAPQFQGHA